MKTNKVSSMSSRAIAITIAAVSALVLACGSSSPSESEGRRYFEHFWLSEALESGNPKVTIGLQTVKSFTKTNGFGDDKNYTMEYKAEFECQKVAYACLKVGQVIPMEGHIMFQKTENGWRATRLDQDPPKK